MVQNSISAYPWMQVYNHRKAETPVASPIFASGMFCSSTRAAIDFMVSIEHEVGVGDNELTTSGSTSLILETGHENSNDMSLS